MDFAPNLLGFLQADTLWIALVFIGIGIFGLYYGAEFLVRGSSRLALAFGVKPLIIGLTLVAFGTSTPELMVSLMSAFGKTNANGLEASLGNAVGSNIANIALILGSTALISPLSVKKSAIKIEFPFMIIFTVVFWVLAFIGYGLNMVDGLILLACFVIFILYCIITRKSGDDEITEDKNLLKNSVLTVLGLIFLGIGGATLVEGGYFVMYYEWHVSPEIIGLTLFAFGTSLPELVTSIIAQLRGHTDISVGNILGSNIFNLALVMGLMALIIGIAKPLAGNVHVDHIPSQANTLSWNFSVMMFFSLLIVVLLFFRRKRIPRDQIEAKGLREKDFELLKDENGKEYIRPHRLGRLAGFILLVLYFAYIYCLFAFNGWAPWNYDPDKPSIQSFSDVEK